MTIKDGKNNWYRDGADQRPIVVSASHVDLVVFVVIADELQAFNVPAPQLLAQLDMLPHANLQCFPQSFANRCKCQQQTGVSCPQPWGQSSS
jgi:hypothetical protein